MGSSLSAYLWAMAKRFKWSLVAMVWVAFFWAFDLCLRPYLLKAILDGVRTLPQGELMVGLAGPFVLFALLPFLMSTTFRIYNYFVEIRMIPALRARVFEHGVQAFLRKNHAFFQNQFTGDLSGRMGNLLDGVPEFFQILIDRFLSNTLALLFAMVTLAQVSWVFSLIMFGWVVLTGIWAFVCAPEVQRRAMDFAAKGTNLEGGFVDTFSNILSVKLFAHVNQEWTFLKGLCNAYVNSEKHLQWRYFWVWLVYGYAYVGMHALTLYILIQGAQDGWVSVGDVALVLTLNLTIASFLWELMRNFTQFSKILGKMRQALKALNTAEEKDAPNAVPLVVSKGEIVFDNVSFGYPNAPQLFQDKSVCLRAGEKVGLVGYSGGGKTTFANLLLRLYEVQSGRILIDGQDISQVTLASLRQAIGVIPQDTSLFHRNLLENIRYGNPGATEAEIVNAAKQAHAHDFITTLEKGYDTLVGERGVKLSGGQRQRIAIARAMLKNAPILILDEATSQLDSVTEETIQRSLWSLMQGKTTLVIAHRLSTLLRMDRILVFQQGKIVEDGTHESLLKAKGLYKTLWDAQVGGFLPEMEKEQNC